ALVRAVRVPGTGQTIGWPGPGLVERTAYSAGASSLTWPAAESSDAGCWSAGAAWSSELNWLAAWSSEVIWLAGAWSAGAALSVAGAGGKTAGSRIAFWMSPAGRENLKVLVTGSKVPGTRW